MCDAIWPSLSAHTKYMHSCPPFSTSAPCLIGRTSPSERKGRPNSVEGSAALKLDVAQKVDRRSARSTFDSP